MTTYLLPQFRSEKMTHHHLMTGSLRGRHRHPLRLWALVSILACVFWTLCPAPEIQGSEQTPPTTPPPTRVDAADGIDVTRLRTIGLRHDANDAETYAARLIQKKIAEYYGSPLRIIKNTGNDAIGDVLLGRHLAIASGIIQEAELNAVKVDGYVVRGSDNRVVIAGYQPQGTQYGAFAFLKLAGLTVYPWHFGDDVEVFQRVKDNMIPAFSISETPFFELRDLFPGHEDGRFGTTLRRYSLADLVFANQDPAFKANGYVGWDHTAGYLVPLHLYYDDHPEYFAFKKGRRIPKSTRNLRVQLCMGNPEVHRIAAERALQWIARQPERRFFMISDGDSGTFGQSPESRKQDPFPDYYTDRALRWVNSVAREIKSTHPDKIVLTLGYMGTVKPPVDITPESNVRVLYAPWYWDSRISSAVSLNHPLNTTAFEEFSGWVKAAPNQLGVYDYPGRFVFGAAERIKLYADHGVRWIYFNGGDGELLHYVAARLLWHPDLDTDGLIKEFTEAFYGPAAPIMDAYLTLRKQTIDRDALHNPVIFDDPVFVTKSRESVSLLEDRASLQPTDLQIRILAGASDILYTVLRATRPDRPKLTGQHVALHPDVYLQDLHRYIGIQKRILALCETVSSCRKRLKWRQTAIYRDLWRLYLAEKSDL